MYYIRIIVLIGQESRANLRMISDLFLIIIGNKKLLLSKFKKEYTWNNG